MSLLLDALKQAEKNKVIAQRPETSIDGDSPVTLESIAVPELNDIELTELEISPEFDLTIYPVFSQQESSFELSEEGTHSEDLSLSPQPVDSEQAVPPKKPHSPPPRQFSKPKYFRQI